MTAPAQATPLSSRVSASVAAPDTESCLAALRALPTGVGSAEVRLDLMTSFSVPRVVEGSPVPLVITYRPVWEGGRFDGPEAERLGVLREAYEAGVAFVDVEATCVGEVAAWGESPTRVIASKHSYDSMPADLWQQYERLRDSADVVKLVGLAGTAADCVPVLELLRDATTPVIALAMGEAGGITRLIGPCFDSCLLTYGVADATKATAGGQFTLDEMIGGYHLDVVSPDTAVTMHVCTTDEHVSAVAERQAAATPGAELHLAVRVGPAERDTTVDRLGSVLPNVRVSAAG